ncbi:Von willebrand factor type A (vWA) domain was originally protein (macronuclear) [Tetrahymena thermophila SB210]|uniref:von willebrand factor type A (VWA) domain was originally protein n=1 Tax=Tetrahymena thermophila (strain SB210) TaxID=312017 RepID=Q22ST4_TETTS|nr:Von willebrand factor type A (vWA) domain was originally protein [Tetrahymena thermophila SB210]EAR88380.2 Von willebrand factor type A (vWA) domain was originally protein [Tetrahymena thermophila SB210]|eukprot:XP_001008625.2 Von willebrand factor type A (vWA) domain was originally protein [Tetrahymena thermophila SB210]
MEQEDQMEEQKQQHIPQEGLDQQQVEQPQDQVQQDQSQSDQGQQQQPQQQAPQAQSLLDQYTEQEILQLATQSIVSPQQMQLLMQYFMRQQSSNPAPLSAPVQFSRRRDSDFDLYEIQENYDDDELTESGLESKMGIEEFQYKLSDNLELDVRCRHKKILVKNNEKFLMPGMITVRTCDLDYEKLLKHHQHLQTLGRQTVDLVVVIDKSGSMEGEKIQLVKETLVKIINLMSSMDRICIVCFNESGDRPLTFTRVTDENKQTLLNLIQQIYAGGGTNISEGINHALKAIQNRKFKNNVTSILLLSDGQDTKAYTRVKAYIDKYQIKDAFNIETIGFGEDHDPKLLRTLSDLRNGTFNFMQDVNYLDTAFINIFAGMISTVAQNIKVGVKFTPPEQFKNFRISKVFGDNWTKVSETQYEINLINILSGVSKDFVFEMEADAFDEQTESTITDENSIFNFITAELTAQSVSSKEEANKQKTFQLQLIDTRSMVEGVEQEEDGEVVENYYRVLSAQAIQEGQNSAEQGNFEQANDNIQKVLNTLLSSRYSKSMNVKNCIDELQNCKQHCNSSNYQKLGQGIFSSGAQSLFKQLASSSSHSGKADLKKLVNFSNNMQKMYAQKYTQSSQN